MQIIAWPAKWHGIALLFKRWNLIFTWPLYLWDWPGINPGPHWDEYMAGPFLIMVFHDPAPLGAEVVREKPIGG
jgi:hypothetical protein